jgi:hypothetical protein
MNAVIQKLHIHFQDLTSGGAGNPWRDLDFDATISSLDMGYTKNDDRLFNKGWVQICNLEVRVSRERGNIREVDCKCDSAFMERAMPEIGERMRED